MERERLTEQNSPAKVTVVLVDDHDIWRDGVRTMLENTEFEVIGEANSGAEALEVVARVQPELILLDIRMAGSDGIETLGQLKALFPAVPVIMLTTYDNPTYMARVIAAGAAGYILKGARRRELIEAMRAVVGGQTLLGPDDLVHSLRCITPGEQGDLPVPLTPRELEILQLVATGLSNRDIARLLFITEGTVKNHVVHIIGKLGVADRVQASVWAVRHGLVSAIA